MCTKLLLYTNNDGLSNQIREIVAADVIQRFWRGYTARRRFFRVTGIQFCINNDESSIKNDEFCIKNDEFRKGWC